MDFLWNLLLEAESWGRGPATPEVHDIGKRDIGKGTETRLNIYIRFYIHMNITRFLYSTNSEMIVFRWTRDANRSYKLSKGCEVWVIAC